MAGKFVDGGQGLACGLGALRLRLANRKRSERRYARPTRRRFRHFDSRQRDSMPEHGIRHRLAQWCLNSSTVHHRRGPSDLGELNRNEGGTMPSDSDIKRDVEEELRWDPDIMRPI